MDSHSDPPPDQDTVVDDAAPSRASTDMHHLTESTPLLLAGAPSSPLPPKRPGTGRSRTESLIKAAAAIHVPKIHNANTIAALFCVIIGIGSSASGLWVVPSTRLVEDVVCREYYGLLGSGDASAGGPIDERQCKEDVIQSKVAMIFAVYATLQAVVGALATFPWGIIADRFGRKKVFSLAVLGMILDQLWFLLLCAFPKTFPMKALWLGPFFLLIGGGNGVLSAVVFSMISDVTTSENRAKKFMNVHVASMAGNLCAPAIAGWMMERTGPWPVVWVALAGFLSMVFTIHLIPETKPAAQAESDPIADGPEADSPVVGAMYHTFHRLRGSLGLLKSPSLVVLVVALLGSYPATESTYQFMNIFASKRYHVSLSQTGYLSSLYGLGTILAILAILPGISKLLASPKAPKSLRFTNDNERDLFLARISSVALIIGTLTLAASPTIGAFIGGLAILALGAGWGSYVRSLCAVYVDAAHRTQMYSIISLIEMVGLVYTQPMLAGLFRAGMRLEGLGIGLPYLVVAGFCLANLGLLLLVRLPPPEDVKHASGDEA
ncbi:major facilitator superfamily transporter [Colletotrichum graminicola M1.001]|uniref:Major facilitator superfamily transporter n=1 Tax=Colletotrichum graminicola (strain M1.001 / M2 / FGSC 10212) TaxID=645133 RepID=E3QM13_COLGM|nr:major facilitator superfamily transporter [Colletotrichum graminicola M1.001]EFQ31901.1 major facilitator superfamily transporter [Colletotrichum graminicola M1.001]